MNEKERWIQYIGLIILCVAVFFIAYVIFTVKTYYFIQ
jgi:hypothetical protein